MLHAVAKHKSKHSSTLTGRENVVRPVHEVEKGVEAPNAARNEILLEGLPKLARLDRLTQGLRHFVGDEAAERGQSEESVWDVSSIRKLTLGTLD